MPAAFSISKILADAAKAAKARDWPAAIEGYGRVLERFPKNPKARKGLETLKPEALPELLAAAQEAQRRQVWAEAERSLLLAQTLGAAGGAFALALSRCQLELGAAPQALETVAAVLEAEPAQSEALNIQGRALREAGRAEASLPVLQAALGGGTEARTLNNLGLSMRALGDLGAARDYFGKALEIEPDNPVLHSNFSQVTDYRKDSAHLALMRASLARVGAETTAAIPLHFALFKAHDALDARDEAFAHLRRGNRLAKAASGYQFQTDAVPYGLSKLLFDAVPDMEFEPSTPRPIFVTGLPRSGTTLVERILAQGEAVQACGELTVVSRAVSPLLRALVARKARSLSRDELGVLRAQILDGLAAYSDGSPILIDKMPLNFRWIGYILSAVPDACIVHLSRDPMAVAWSLYRHAFTGQGLGFTNDFADIARFMAMQADLMDHWRTRFPGRITDLRYDQLVSDPGTTTRALAGEVGLEWSERWVMPETADSQIRTASAVQARQPIYKNSDADWERYAAQLAPLADMLRAAKLI